MALGHPGVLRHPARDSWVPSPEADAPLPDAARERFRTLGDDLRRETRRVCRDPDADDVHDLRVAARRLQVAVGAFGGILGDRERRTLADELDRLSKRLGDIRDLDVLLDSLSTEGQPDAPRLRRAWTRDRKRARRRLLGEFGRPRFKRFLKALRRAGHRPTEPRGVDPRPDLEHLPRLLRHDAPARIVDAVADVLAFSIDPATAEVDAIHGMRKQAKQLRDTLRGYEDVFGPEAGRLAERVSVVQDAAGELHDADVGATRARGFLRDHEDLDPPETAAIGTFVARQEDRMLEQRRALVGLVADLRGQAFRMRVAALVSDGLTGGAADGRDGPD